MIDVTPAASSQVAIAITTSRQLIAGATSENARRSYQTGWRQFTALKASDSSRSGHSAVVATFQLFR